MIEEEQEDEEGWRQVGKNKTKTQRRTPRRGKTKKKNASENPARPSSFAEGNGEERRRQMDDMGG